MPDPLGLIELSSASGEPGFGLVVLTGPQPPPTIWPSVAAAAVVLVAAALFALHRSRRRDRAPPGRISRIVWSSLACGAGVALILAPDSIMGNLSLDVLELTADTGFAFVGWTFLVVLLFGSADLTLDAFRPRRTLAWLLIGPSLLTLYTVGFLAASQWLEGFDPGPAGPTPLAAIAAAALIWWSLLPATGDRGAARDVSAIFE